MLNSIVQWQSRTHPFICQELFFLKGSSLAGLQDTNWLTYAMLIVIAWKRLLAEYIDTYS